MKMNSLVALQLDDGNCKLLHLNKTKKSFAIQAAATLPLQNKDSSQCAQALKQLLAKLNIHTPWAIVSFSRARTTSRLLNLPATDLAELRNMVGFQALKLVPFSKDEMVLDFTPIAKSQEGYTWVTVVMVPKKEMDRLLEILNQAGLIPLSLRLNTQEAAIFYREYFSEKNKSKAWTLFVDFDVEEVHFVVTQEGEHLFSRTVSLLKASLAAEDPTSQQRLKTELENTWALYKKEAPAFPLEKPSIHSPSGQSY